MGTRHRPIYRARLYAPRSVDPAEATLLTPRAGSAHADEFKVASKDGVAGYQPFLHGGPRGRSSEIDPLDKATDIGEQVWTILDKRTGSGNLSRWLTAYFGDTKGGNQLLGLRWEVDESLDNGGSWNRFSTSRVQAVRRSSGSKVWMQIYVRDVTDDLDNDIFVGPPHTAVANYAHHAQVAPIGLLRSYGDFKKVTPIRATVGSLSGSGTYAFRLDVDKSQADREKTLATKALSDLARYKSGSSASSSYGRGTVWIAPAGTPLGDAAWVAYDFDWVALVRSTSIEAVYARPKTGTTTPALSASVDFYIETHVGGVSESLPLLIDEVHPITLLKHLLLGYFGKLTVAGAVTWSVAFNAANFAAFEADTSLRKVRFIETDKAKLHEWVTENLLRPNHLALKVNAHGELEVVDFRRSATTAAAFALTNADLVSSKDAVDWNIDRAEAISGLSVLFYGERFIANSELPKPFEALDPETTQHYEPPDIPTVRIEELSDYPVTLVNLGSRALDVGGDDYELPCRGLRFRAGADERDSEKDVTTGGPRQHALAAYCAGLASDLRGPFGLGPTYYELVCLRSSAQAALCKPGVSGTIDIDEIPDPATNLRGGPRIVMCLSRIEEGPNVRLRLLDWGANSVGVAPTVGAPALSANLPASAFTLPITLNTDNQVVRVEIAITPTSLGVRPAAASDLWQTVSYVDADATITVARIAGAGKRVWIRARSEPAPGRGFSLPSDWAFPAANYIDLTGLTAPSAVNVTSPAGDRATATWTNGGPDLAVEVFIVAGAAAPTGLETERVTLALAPGSVQLEISGRTTAGAQYTVGVRHVDDVGNVSAMASFTFVAGAATALNPPTDPDGFSRTAGGSLGGRIGRSILGGVRSIGIFGLAVVATEFPSFIEFAMAVETGVGTGAYGAYTTVATVESIAGDWTTWSTLAPHDGKRRRLKARHIRDGATPSAYTAEVTVIPGTNDPLGSVPWALVAGIPTTLDGFGLTAEFESAGDARWAQIVHTHAFADLTGIPTTLAGYGIVDVVAAGLLEVAGTGAFGDDVTAPNFVLSGGGGGGSVPDPGAPVEVLDEGSSLTVEVMSLNFVGSGVTAAAVGNAVTVNVTPRMAPAEPFYLDGGGDTFLVEASANNVEVWVGGSAIMVWTPTRVAIAAPADLSIQPTKRLYLDGAGDTYLHEYAANSVAVVVGGNQRLVVNASTLGVAVTGTNLALDAGKAIYLDGGFDTYIHESSANRIELVAGGTVAVAAVGSAAQVAIGAGWNFSVEPTQRIYLDGGANTYLLESAADQLEAVVGGSTSFYAYGNALAIRATNRLYLDSGGDTYLYEPSADLMRAVVGGGTAWSVDTALFWSSKDFAVNATNKIFLDGGANTYFYEHSADHIGIVVGGTLTAQVWSGGSDGGLAVYSTKKLALDGGGDTYFVEASANNVEVWVGGSVIMVWTPTRVAIAAPADLSIQPTKRLYFDGAGDTYLLEASANTVRAYAGGVNTVSWDDTKFYVHQGFALTASAKFYLDGGTDTYIWQVADNAVEIVTGNTVAARLEATKFIIGNTSKLYLDGGVDTYLWESFSNQVSVVAGGTTQITFGGGNAVLQATGKVFFDGGGDTYIYESSANVMSFVAGGTFTFHITGGGIIIPDTFKLWLDGGGDSYLTESAANVISIFTGGVERAKVNSSGVTAANFILA